VRTEDLILVSVDDHVIEPPGMFDGRLPARYQELAPTLVHRDDGTDFWHYNGSEIPNVGLNAVVGRPPDEYGIEPSSLAEMRPGCYDVHERVRDMSANGVLGSMCFPSFPQFCGQLFARRAATDADEALAMVRAYNDWHVDGWCGAEPGRFIPLALPVLWDPGLAAADLLWSPVLRRFADLRFALSEGGIGWIPYALERIDYVYRHHHAWTGQDFGDQLPSQLFKDRIITCFIDDAFGIDNRRYLNIDNITWECDYPHSDSTWPQSPEMAMKYLADVPDDEIDKITHANAMAHFHFDPFAVRPRRECTVGALRREAVDVDTSIVSRRRHPVEPRSGIVDLGTVARTFEHIGEPDRDG